MLSDVLFCSVMRLRKKLRVVAPMVIIAVSFAVYAWTAYEGVWCRKNQETRSDVTRFKTVANGMSSMDVVPFDISDGLTMEEAKLIAESTFIQVMGRNVMSRLDTLTFNDTQVEACYTWGYDENDMGHIFNMTADLTTLQITVSHCY